MSDPSNKRTVPAVLPGMPVKPPRNRSARKTELLRPRQLILSSKGIELRDMPLSFATPRLGRRRRRIEVTNTGGEPPSQVYARPETASSPRIRVLLLRPSMTPSKFRHGAIALN